MTPLGRRGYVVENWNTDQFDHHNETTRKMYLSIPFMIGYRPGRGSAWGYYLDSSYRSQFDLASADPRRLDIRVALGDFVFYLITGSGFPQILERYTALTGRPALPPLWALGYHQARYSYMSTADSWTVAQELRRRKIPCDAIWFDIHHMDGYRVFTFDPDRFGDVENHFWGLGELGFKKVVILDPGVKDEPPGNYSVLDEGVERGYFLRTSDGEEFVGPAWPGGSRFPDFTNPEVRKWWGDLHQFYWDAGVDAVWNDMNEPAVLDERKTLPDDVRFYDDGHWSNHDRIHNVYALAEAKATVEEMKRQFPGQRPFVLSRAGSPGIQRLAAVWTGDNTSTWAHLKASLAQVINLGLSGLGFCGADVGGFSENSTPELLVRWYQLGAFYPFFRNHSMIESIRQEPWVFGEETEELIRRAIRMRYRLLPLFYQLFHQMHRTGAPLVRPLFWHYHGERAARVTDQFLLGEDLLVAPVVERGARERMVWLPPGSWYDYHSGHLVGGDVTLVVDAPLETVNVYVRGGAVLPVAEVGNSTEDLDRRTLALEIYPGGETEGLLWEDDGRTTEPPLEHRYSHGGEGRFAMTMSPDTGYQSVRLIWVDPDTGRRSQMTRRPGVIETTREEDQSQ
jgi:alpha-glucosidase